MANPMSANGWSDYVYSLWINSSTASFNAFVAKYGYAAEKPVFPSGYTCLDDYNSYLNQTYGYPGTPGQVRVRASQSGEAGIFVQLPERSAEMRALLQGGDWTSRTEQDFILWCQSNEYQIPDGIKALKKKDADYDAMIAASKAVYAEFNAKLGTEADRQAAASKASQVLSATIPAPMGCDWNVRCVLVSSCNQMWASIDSVLCPSVMTSFWGEGTTVDESLNDFLAKLNANAAVIALEMYSAVIKGVTGESNTTSDKATADKKIWSALTDLNRFPPVPYDETLAKRSDLAGVLSARQKDGTSAAIVTDVQQAGQGNYPPAELWDTGQIGTLPVVSIPYESDRGYEPELENVIQPNIPTDQAKPILTNRQQKEPEEADAHPLAPEIALPPGYPIRFEQPVLDLPVPAGIVFPNPATGNNYQYTPQPGGNILPPSKLGTDAADVAEFVQGSVVGDNYQGYGKVIPETPPKDRERSDEIIPDRVKAAKEERQDDSRTLPVPVSTKPPPATGSATPPKATNQPADATSITQSKYNWLTVGGALLVLVGVFYLSKQQAQ